MRLHLRRVLSYAALLGIFVLIMLNIYNIDTWQAEFATRIISEEAMPKMQPPVLDPSYKLRHPGAPLVKFMDKHFHAHLSQVKPNTTTPASSKVPPPIWPEEAPNDDRIVNQLSLTSKIPFTNTTKKKVILSYNGLPSEVQTGQESLIKMKCPINNCFLTGDTKAYQETADAILFQGGIVKPVFKRPRHQKWVLFLLESPYHTPGFDAFRNMINWTATYRHDSTLVAPYEKYVPYKSPPLLSTPPRNYAAGKHKQVAWFVSNCGARNRRREFADELSKFINVDIYGSCGSLQCRRHESEKCFDMLKNDYKFYLSFENSNCEDYITEKFFVNALQ